MSGRDTRVVVSEAGVYRLVFRSRKPEAERFKRWLAHDVLPQLRKTGRYEIAATAAAASSSAAGVDSLAHRIQILREARLLFGHARARSLWHDLDLPAVPPPPHGPLDEARDCLRHLLDTVVIVEADDSPTIRDLIERALDDEEEARLILRRNGIRVMTPDDDGFFVANRAIGLHDVFAGTDWAGGRQMRVLRRLPGADAGRRQRFERGPTCTTFIAADLLDERR